MLTIKLLSLDGVIFEVDVEIAIASSMLRDLLDYCKPDKEAIPLRVKWATLQKIMDWATYHKDDPSPPEDHRMEQKTVEISAWNAEFLNVDQEFLFSLILAANYLDIKGLLAVATQKVANIMETMTVEKVRQHFNIKNDFTPSEEELIRKEGEWRK